MASNKLKIEWDNSAIIGEIIIAPKTRVLIMLLVQGGLKYIGFKRQTKKEGIWTTVFLFRLPATMAVFCPHCQKAVEISVIQYITDILNQIKPGDILVASAWDALWTF